MPVAYLVARFALLIPLPVGKLTMRCAATEPGSEMCLPIALPSTVRAELQLGVDESSDLHIVEYLAQVRHLSGNLALALGRPRLTPRNCFRLNGFAPAAPNPLSAWQRSKNHVHLAPGASAYMHVAASPARMEQSMSEGRLLAARRALLERIVEEVRRRWPDAGRFPTEAIRQIGDWILATPDLLALYFEAIGSRDHLIRGNPEQQKTNMAIGRAVARTLGASRTTVARLERHLFLNYSGLRRT